MPWVLYLFYEEVCQTRKAKQAQPQSSQTGEEFSSTVLNASIFFRSKTRKPFMKYSHKIQESTDLTRPPQPYYNEQAVFTKGMGRSDTYLHRALPSCILVTCSYTCLWDQSWTQVQVIQTFQLPPFCQQRSVMVFIPLQGVICNGFSSFSGTFNGRTQIIPP